MKRIVPLLLTLSLLLGLCAGCGTTSTTQEASASTAEAASTPEETQEEVSEAAPAPEASVAEEVSVQEESAVEEVTYEPISYPLDGNVSFSWFMSYPGIMEIFVTNPFYDYEAWNEWMVRTGVTIDWYLVSGFETSAEQFNLLIASGDYPDVFMSNLTSNSTVDEMVDQDIIYDLKDLIPENMPDYMAFIADNEDFAASIGTESSEGYWGGLHTYTANTHADAGLVMRGDWLSDLNLEVPTTYDDLHDVLTAFKNNGASSPLWINYNGYLPNNSLIAGFDTVGAAGTDSSAYPFFQIDGEVFYGSTAEGFKEYISLLSQWYAEGLIYSDFMSATDSNTQPPSDIIINGECGVCVQTLDSYHQWDDSSDTFSMVAVPEIRKNEDQVLHLIGSTSSVSTTVLCVSTACQNVETVLQAFNYDFTEDGYLLMNYGIENDTFVFDENGDPQLTDVVLKSELPDVSLALSVYTGTDSNAYPGIRDNARGWALYDEAQQTASEVWENPGDDDAYVYPALCSMNLEESAQFNAKIADISTYVSEKTLAWIVGTGDVNAEWDEFVANVEAMGIADCIAAKQSALDRYYAQQVS
jgi:putative aldouronate transport system substrate-binding protein